VEISDATPVTLARWPLWTWFAYPALAIAIGGGLGYAVAAARQRRDPAPLVHVTTTAEPVAAPQPSAPSPEVAPPSPEIELPADSVRAVTPKLKGKPKPTKRCNVYDHMNGC
jgi:hypothetical protein